MVEAEDELRLAVAARINRAEYPEYRPGGWVKTCPLTRLRAFGPEASELFAAYRAGTADGIEVRLWIIRLFLEQVMCELIPESSPALGISQTPLRQVNAAEAQDLVAAIVAVGIRERTGVDYEPLRRDFFGRLFQPGAVQWFANSSPAGVRAGSLSAAIGLDRQLVGAFWLG
jgi:hypothetical protein